MRVERGEDWRDRGVEADRIASRPAPAATPEDTTAVTQADSLRAVLRAVKHFEPRELVVTGGSDAAETEDVFRHTGMLSLVEAGSRPSSTTTCSR